MILNRFWLPLALLVAIGTLLMAQENSADAPGRGTLVVTINGFKNTDGQVRVYLFGSPDGFPSKPDRALVTRKVKVTGPEVEVRVLNLPYGEYAVAAHHDVNGNDKLDHNWLHIPKEPTGASNGARGKFGPPKFDKAKFQLTSDTTYVTVSVK
jgi:uncharacterized protein (DUF2141 family)